MSTSPIPVYIKQANAVTGLGLSLNDTWLPLLNGKTGIEPVTRFDTADIPYHLGAALPFDGSASPTSTLIDLVTKRLQGIASDAEVIWTGSKGDVEFIEFQNRQGFPHFAAFYRAYAAEKLGCTGKGFEVNAACASATVGLALAAQRIRSGAASSIVVCGADILSRFVHFGFSSLKALSPSGCRPFDAQRDGLCLGEGAFAIELANSPHPSAGKPLTLSGWAITNDANHITGPARDGRGLINAIETALKMSGHSPDELEAWCAHGTGTVYNDAMELTAMETLFGKRKFPLFSVKGAIGHTLGAAGGIETALCTKTMETGRIPPTTGLREPESRAVDRASAAVQSFKGNLMLNTNSGFGGVNSALIIERHQKDIGP